MNISSKQEAIATEVLASEPVHCADDLYLSASPALKSLFMRVVVVDGR